MTRININDVQKLSGEGKSPEEIAKILKTTVTKIKWHLYRAKHIKKVPTQSFSFDTFEEAADFWIRVLQDSKRLQVVLHDNQTLLKENTRLTTELDKCHEKVKVLTQKQEAYLLAVKQGSVKEPVNSG